MKLIDINPCPGNKPRPMCLSTVSAMTMDYGLGRQIVMKFQFAAKTSAFDMFTHLDPRAFLLNDLSN